MPTSSLNSSIDISKLGKNEPIQPTLASYPKTVYGNQRRGIPPSWYSKYEWVEYIKEHDMALC